MIPLIQLVIIIMAVKMIMAVFAGLGDGL